jgi:hypothetical protein
MLVDPSSEQEIERFNELDVANKPEFEGILPPESKPNVWLNNTAKSGPMIIQEIANVMPGARSEQ